MAATTNQLLDYVKSKLGTPYVYGYKMTKVTESGINSLANQYPDTFTASYIAKAKKLIGQVAADCSGLITACTGILRGSANMKEKATYCEPISKLNESHTGYILWRSGHVGVYIGNGECIEARGIDYGTVRSKVDGRGFTHIILIPELNVAGQAQPTLQDVQYKLKQALGLADGSATLADAQKLLREVLGLGDSQPVSSAVNAPVASPIKYDINILHLQIALNADGFRDSSENRLVEDGIYGTKTESSINRVLLSTKTMGKYVSITAWVQHRVGAVPDGSYGSNTKMAVTAYQLKKGLSADGIAGPMTIKKIVQEYV